MWQDGRMGGIQWMPAWPADLLSSCSFDKLNCLQLLARSSISATMRRISAVSFSQSTGVNRAGSGLPAEPGLHTCCLYFKLLQCILWCQRIETLAVDRVDTMAPPSLISVCLCSDFRLLHSMDLCLLVLTEHQAWTTSDLWRRETSFPAFKTQSHSLSVFGSWI